MLQATASNQFILPSLDKELQIVNEMRSNNPSAVKCLFERGESLIRMAKFGEYRKLRNIVDNLETGEFIPIHFVSRMLFESLCAGHLILAGYIIDSGYPIRSTSIPSALHTCLDAVDDDVGVIIVNFLTTKKYDISMQARPTWLTALHIAVRRQMVKTVASLLELGADVNAVAEGDIMPLNLAEAAPDSDSKETIITLLRNRNAKSTWRKEDATTKVTFQRFTGGGPLATSSLVGFKGFTGGTPFCATYSPGIMSAASTTTMFTTPAGLTTTATISDEAPQPSLPENEGETSAPTYSTSDDGGLMFSTCSSSS